MNKKFKYTSVVAAGAITLGLVGGTLAWFTSEHVKENIFTTAGNNQSVDNNGNGSSIVIKEDFKETDAAAITPDTTVNKDVQVQNTNSYNQFIKASIKVLVTDPAVSTTERELGVVYNPNGNYYHVEEYDKIRLYFTKHLATSGVEGTWYNIELASTPTETIELGDFYYVGQVKPTGHTNTLLDSVELSQNATSEYENIRFNVVITANGIQTTHKAAEKKWGLENTIVKGFYTADDNGNPTASEVDSVDGLETTIDGNKEAQECTHTNQH